MRPSKSPGVRLFAGAPQMLQSILALLRAHPAKQHKRGSSRRAWPAPSTGLPHRYRRPDVLWTAWVDHPTLAWPLYFTDDTRRRWCPDRSTGPRGQAASTATGPSQHEMVSAQHYARPWVGNIARRTLDCRSISLAAVPRCAAPRQRTSQILSKRPLGQNRSEHSRSSHWSRRAHSLASSWQELSSNRRACRLGALWTWAALL